jgi:outer membrane protein TolC
MLPRTLCSLMNRVTGSASAVALACSFCFIPLVCWAEGPAEGGPIPFRQAVDMALEHSGIMGIATMNQWRAHNVYNEARNNYIPQVTIGSGLGYSYGFPLTLEGAAPSLVNFSSLQSLFNPSLKQFVKAARIDWKATSFDVQDKRNAVILDTALTYAQLDQLTGKLKALGEAQAAAYKAQFVTEQRLQEGVDSKLELTKSQLVTARIKLRMAEAQGQADVLREHLAKLLAVPPDSIIVAPGSLPQLPPISQDDDLLTQAVQNSPAVRIADQKAVAAETRAKGEHRALLPTVDLASQYAYLARFNNYDQYYRKYSSNNFSGGLSIRFSIFNSVQKARAEQADADALMARKQAEISRDQVREEALKLQRSLRQLAAASDVAKLEWEVAQGDLEAVKARLEAGNANTRDQQNAELDVDDRYAAYLDSEFALKRAELQLLRLTGEIENWAIPPP